jgi:serine phosphatase RsbU (regulator of sigma subunit)
LGRAVLDVDDPVGVGWVTGTGTRHWQPAEPTAHHSPARSEADLLRDYRPGDPVLTVPLTSGGRTLGAMAVGGPSDDPEDGRLIEELGVRAGAALDNAALYDAERRLGLTLQRSLLPGQLPALPGLELAARYLPGTEGTEVGGDFYLARVLPDGRMLLILGDVMGHGIPAAARMGQLRTMLATLAYSCSAPDVVLTRAAEQAEELIDLQLATVLVAIYDPADRRLTVASAGHPPPLLAPVEAEPAFVNLRAGPPLGVGSAVYRAVTVDVPAAATLVLYTDGLIEERGEAIDEGLERLRLALCSVRLPPDAVCTHVLRELGRTRGGEDDVALLVLSHADPMHQTPAGSGNDST